MPLGDGTGPLGKGPCTGRGMGGCITGRTEIRNTGQGKEIFGGIDFEELKKQAKQQPQTPISKEQKLEFLKKQLATLQNQMNEIRKQIDATENE